MRKIIPDLKKKTFFDISLLQLLFLSDPVQGEGTVDSNYIIYLSSMLSGKLINCVVDKVNLKFYK